MDDEPGREAEHLTCEMEVLRPVLPQGRNALVEDGMAEQPPDDAALALHGVEVAVSVAAADREAGDEVVEDEVVQHDDAGSAAQRLDDPAVRLRIVADVVDAEIDVPRGGFFAPRLTTTTSQRACSAGSRSAE